MRKVFAQKPAVPGSQERATRSACRALRGTSRGRRPRSPWHLAMLQCCRRAPELDRKPRLCACRSRARHFDSRIDIAAMPEVLFDPALIVMAWSEGQSVLREAITRRPNPDPHKPRGRNSISLAFVLKRGKTGRPWQCRGRLRSKASAPSEGASRPQARRPRRPAAAIPQRERRRAAAGAYHNIGEPPCRRL